MPWLSGIFSRATGAETGSSAWQDTETSGKGILSSEHDTHDQDLADGINACLTKDGSNALTGDLNAGSHKLTEVAEPTADTDGATKQYVDALKTAARTADLDMDGHQIKNSSYEEIAASTVSTGTHTFDMSLGDFQQITATGNINIDVSNFPSGVCVFIIKAVNWGAHVVTPAGNLTGLNYAGGTFPTLTSSGSDELMIRKDGAGNYALFVVGLDVK